MYINTTTQTVHSEQDIRVLFASTSFPSPFVPPNGYEYVFPAPAQYDPKLQYAIQATPVLTNKGHWEEQWTIINKTLEQVAAEEAAARAALIPKQVTMRQARLAMLQAGILANVDSIIAAMPEPQKSAAKIEWEYAAVVERDNGLVPAMGATLNMTETQLDDLFILAATL